MSRVAWHWWGFLVVIYLAALQDVPEHLYEAAAIDGAGRLKQFSQITLPMLKPVVVPSVTLGTIWTFNKTVKANGKSQYYFTHWKIF